MSSVCIPHLPSMHTLTQTAAIKGLQVLPGPLFDVLVVVI